MATLSQGFGLFLLKCPLASYFSSSRRRQREWGGRRRRGVSREI
jgi:hypothetical protein